MILMIFLLNCKVPWIVIKVNLKCFQSKNFYSKWDFLKTG